MRVLSDENILDELASLVQGITGVQLGKKQESLVRSRVAKRMREVGVHEIAGYWNFFNEHKDNELNALVSLLTTHHTFFFREYAHFELLMEQLPEMVARARAEGRTTLTLWSAACSYGHEPYSLAMFMETHLPTYAPDMSFKVVATDVCAESVERAKKGIYRWTELQKVPKAYLSGNWLRGTAEIQDFVKATDRLKSRIEFKVLNLMDFQKDLVNKKFDFIFCRNVFIYFTPEDVRSISAKMQKFLWPSGYLVLGLSESLGGDLEELQHRGRSSYQYMTKTSQPVSAPVKVVPATATVSRNPIMRVLCVDDSPVVLKLLKKILSKEHGFEVVGTAMNGQEAQDFLSKNEVDLVTLDIHMPVMDGVSYLEKNFKHGHPPVVMLSSVAEEGRGPSMRCLELGASDYVEKPTLANLQEKSEEIIGKLKAVHFQRREKLSATSLDFVRTITPITKDPALLNSCSILYADCSQLDKVTYIVQNTLNSDAPLWVVLSGEKDQFESAYSRLKERFKARFDKVGFGGIHVIWAKEYSQKRIHVTFTYAAVMLLAAPDPIMTLEWLKFKAKSYIVEEVTSIHSTEFEKLRKLASCMVPYTSFAWEAMRALREIEKARAA